MKLKRSCLSIKDENIEDEFGYYESELKLITHGTPEDYKETLVQRILDQAKFITPPPKLVRQLREADDDERQRILDELRKETMLKCIAPDDEQVIHYKDWADPHCFFKPSMMHAFHPHWRLAHDRILKNFKPGSDTLLVMFCSGTKPYSANQTYKVYLNAAKQGVFDFMVASLYPVLVHPFDASRLYPYVMSDWPHRASSRLTEVYRRTLTEYTREILEKGGYKKVIYLHNGLKNRSHVVDLIRERAPEGCEIIEINMHDQLVATHPPFAKNSGLMSVRWSSTRLSREALAKECNDPDKAREALKLPKRAPESSLEGFAS